MSDLKVILHKCSLGDPLPRLLNYSNQLKSMACSKNIKNPFCAKVLA